MSEKIVTEWRNPYYTGSERTDAERRISDLEAKNTNLQRAVTKLLENRVRVCPDCRERHEVRR